MVEWTGQLTKAANPLAGYEEKPVISSAGPHARYLGRVIIEVWENSRHSDVSGSAMLAYTAQTGKSSHISNADLLSRVIRTLGPRVARDRAQQRR